MQWTEKKTTIKRNIKTYYRVWYVNTSPLYHPLSNLKWIVQTNKFRMCDETQSKRDIVVHVQYKELTTSVTFLLRKNEDSFWGNVADWSSFKVFGRLGSFPLFLEAVSLKQNQVAR